ncbi:MAG TPA: DUF1501 domain-containing protein [Gemmataceae bacterium]|nr:DUF1501 domain-containing protein [Gemmataceae bacterium]
MTTKRSANALSRRDLLRLTAAGCVGFSMSGWLERMAAAAAKGPQRKRACILLWMNGGPSQMDTFDLKPGHANGGPFKEIATNAPGVRFSEHLPKLAKHGDKLAVIRSMKTKEADHGRATYLMRTGRAPGGPIQYPVLGALVAKELETPEADLPGFVSIAPVRFLSPGAFGSGFLGPQYAPLIVGENAVNFVVGQGQPDIGQFLKVQDLDLPTGVSGKRSAARVKMLDEMEQDFIAERPGAASVAHRAAYQRAVTMMRSEAVKAFDLDKEPKELRDRYGRNLFGQGCLLARRLVERGVPFVEVTLNNVPNLQVFGWDTHQDNFNSVQKLSSVLDPGWATLLEDLKDKGLLDTTLVVWMGEFGRTPKINGGKGRDHWANSWSTVLSGGGIKGGQVVGKTSADGTTVEERPVAVADLLATISTALGIDPTKQNRSNVGRPIRITDPGAKPIQEVLA